MSDRDGDFTRYVEARGGALLRTAVFLCAGDRPAAEDLVQSTLVRAYVAWHRVRDEGARDAYVRRSPRPSLPRPSPTGCPYRLGRSRRLAKSFEHTTTSATGWLEVACVDTTPRHRNDT